MKETEVRFKIDENSIDLFREKVSSLGFKKSKTKKMTDIVFENPEQAKLEKLMPGHYFVRIRLESNSKPKLEIKKLERENVWEEFSSEIDNPKEILNIISRILILGRIIRKKREVWVSDAAEIAFDNLDHLGNFIEIEAEEGKIKKICDELELNMKEKQPPYGTLLFYLQKKGVVKFSLDDAFKVLNGYSNFKNGE